MYQPTNNNIPILGNLEQPNNNIPILGNLEQPDSLLIDQQQNLDSKVSRVDCI